MQTKPNLAMVSKIGDRSLISNVNSIHLIDQHAEPADSNDSKQNKRLISYF